MTSSCSQWSVPDTTDAEAVDIKSAISLVASSTSIDPRFILAIMMQESNGCVRVPTHKLWRPKPRSYAEPRWIRNLQRWQRANPMPIKRDYSDDLGRCRRHIARRWIKADYGPGWWIRRQHLLQGCTNLQLWLN